jgi:hypothetical protein
MILAWMADSVNEGLERALLPQMSQSSPRTAYFEAIVAAVLCALCDLCG